MFGYLDPLGSNARKAMDSAEKQLDEKRKQLAQPGGQERLLLLNKCEFPYIGPILGLYLGSHLGYLLQILLFGSILVPQSVRGLQVVSDCMEPGELIVWSLCCTYSRLSGLEDGDRTKQARLVCFQGFLVGDGRVPIF